LQGENASDNNRGALPISLKKLQKITLKNVSADNSREYFLYLRAFAGSLRAQGTESKTALSCIHAILFPSCITVIKISVYVGKHQLYGINFF
jgi:hypothetical protein